MKSILILCETNPARNPRPYRMIQCLRDHYKITVVSSGTAQVKGTTFIPLEIRPPRKFFAKLSSFIALKLHLFERVIWTGKLRHLRSTLLQNDYDVIITCDLNLLPLAVNIKKKAKLLLDAREYYPRQFEDQFKWRFFSQGKMIYLCQRYLRLCDKIITVCDSLAREYYKNYGVSSEVIMSWPPFHDLAPAPTDPKKIKIIHHGSVTPSRKIELMIELMDYLDRRFTLDLMLLPSNSGCWKRLATLASRKKNVRIIPTVPMPEIVSFTHQYDMGLFLLKPTNFNVRFALPNKLFEFIQARLMIAIGPSVEMKKIVEKYDCGIVAENFEPRILAGKINALTVDQIMHYKRQSHKAALQLNAEANNARILAITEELIRSEETNCRRPS